MCRSKEALESIKAMDKVTISPAEAAPVFGCDPHFIRLKARTDPASLGFPVTVLGHRTKIPRIPFIRYVEGGGWAW